MVGVERFEFSPLLARFGLVVIEANKSTLYESALVHLVYRLAYWQPKMRTKGVLADATSYPKSKLSTS